MKRRHRREIKDADANSATEPLIGRDIEYCPCAIIPPIRSTVLAIWHNTIFNLMRDHRCELSSGAKATYVAMILWFVAAMLALCAEDGPGERRACSDDGALEYADSNSATEPLIQDVISECEQSTYSAGQDGEE